MFTAIEVSHGMKRQMWFAGPLCMVGLMVPTLALMNSSLLPLLESLNGSGFGRWPLMERRDTPVFIVSSGNPDNLPKPGGSHPATSTS